jgi:hypothetical protein
MATRSSTRYMTISELEAGSETAPIWALNGSAESDAGQVGDVQVGIPKINGSKIDPLFLPQTWLPQCLTDQIPRRQLLQATEFRQAVHKNLIVLITQAYADTLLAGEGAQEEKERLIEQKRHIREATAARSITQSNADIINTSEISDAAPMRTERNPNEFEPSFLLFAENLQLKSDIEALNLIRGRGKVTRREVEHLVHLLHDKPKTVKTLKARLEK